MPPKTHKNFTIVLALFHLVGVLGLWLNVVPGFVNLTPLTLLLFFGLSVWAEPNKSSGFWLGTVVSIVAGFAVEVAGVQTGAIFGSYAYGTVLGPTLWGVPLIIGINWAMLVLGALSVVGAYVKKTWLAALLSAGLVTGIDVIIEPVAIKLGFWHWYGQAPPLQNYIAWFVIAFGISLVYQLLRPSRQNITARRLFFMQVLFFSALYVLIH